MEAAEIAAIEPGSGVGTAIATGICGPASGANFCFFAAIPVVLPFALPVTPLALPLPLTATWFPDAG
jgi:hypothetical protein